MAKHEADPVLERLVRAVNESGQARLQVQVSAQGGTFAATSEDDKGPFARLLGA